jgi:primary-amine oxidase
MYVYIHICIYIYIYVCIGFYVKETPLLTEIEAQCDGNTASGRFWKISNPDSLHPVTGKPVAWKIHIHDTPLMLATEDSLLNKRGKFATKSIWVTPHSEV